MLFIHFFLITDNKLQVYSYISIDIALLLYDIQTEDSIMVEKNVKKEKAKKLRVTNGFNTGTRDMKLKTAYRREKRWSADADH